MAVSKSTSYRDDVYRELAEMDGDDFSRKVNELLVQALQDRGVEFDG